MFWPRFDYSCLVERFFIVPHLRWRHFEFLTGNWVLMHCELQGFMAASKSWKGINPQEREKYEAMAQKLKVRIVSLFQKFRYSKACMSISVLWLPLWSAGQTWTVDLESHNVRGTTLSFPSSYCKTTARSVLKSCQSIEFSFELAAAVCYICINRFTFLLTNFLPWRVRWIWELELISLQNLHRNRKSKIRWVVWQLLDN